MKKASGIFLMVMLVLISCSWTGGSGIKDGAITGQNRDFSGYNGIPAAADSAKVVDAASEPGAEVKYVRSAFIALSPQGVGPVTVTGRVMVVDESRIPVAGAVVSAVWTIPGSSGVNRDAVTDRRGVATFKVHGNGGKYTLTVTDITADGYTFDPANSVLSQSIRR